MGRLLPTYCVLHAGQPIIFYFSNTINDPIEFEEVEEPFESSEQGSTFGEEASTEENFKDISSAPGETETTEEYLDKRATTVGEGQYEHTS